MLLNEKVGLGILTCLTYNYHGNSLHIATFVMSTFIVTSCSFFLSIQPSLMQVVELLTRKLENETSFHRRVDLFFLVDSITQCSHSHKGKDSCETILHL